MSAKSILPLIVLIAASHSVHSDDITVDNTVFVSARSRQDVLAELEQFKKSGTSPWSIRYSPLHTFKSQRSREEVTAELLNQRDVLRQFVGEDSGSSYMARRHAEGKRG